jgi:Tol biopolymer transport system component
VKAGEGSELYPVWTSTDDRIAFGLINTDVIQWKATNNTGQVTELAAGLGNGTQSATPYFFTPDDQGLVFREQAHPETGDNVAMVSLGQDSELTFLLHSEFSERNAALSPNGNWMAYQSDESGQYEVYVRPFPNIDDGLWTISTAGGAKPLWSAEGQELFYIEPGVPNHMMRVEVQTGETFSHGSPSPLLESPYFSVEEGRAYDISPDGQRFIALKLADDNDDGASPPPQINVVQNWFEVLKRLAPTD